MISLLAIQNRISELECGCGPQSMDIQIKNRAVVDILYWLKNGQDLRTDEEIKNKIDRIQEEALGLSRSDKMYEVKLAQIYELENYI